MNKESLNIIKEELIKIINNKNINEVDKIELLINLWNFLDNYDENIKILRKYSKRKWDNHE